MTQGQAHRVTVSQPCSTAWARTDTLPHPCRCMADTAPQSWHDPHPHTQVPAHLPPRPPLLSWEHSAPRSAVPFQQWGFGEGAVGLGPGRGRQHIPGARTREISAKCVFMSWSLTCTICLMPL